MSEEWCCEKLENLKIKENRLATLTEIHTRLNEPPSGLGAITSRLLRAPEIYECCSTGNESAEKKNEQDLACDILTICMGNLSISQNEGNFPQLVKRALEHESPRIRSLAITTILKEVEHEQDPAKLRELVPDDLVECILGTLKQPETEVGVPACNLLSILLKDRLRLPAVRDALIEMLTADEAVKCRVYELAVNLAKSSPSLLPDVEFILSSALAELDNDDTLLQVNILEILCSLAEQNHGLVYLEQRQVFEVLSHRIENLEHNPIDRLLVPGIMKFFGKIASVQPQKIIVGYPHMVECLFECLHTTFLNILPVAFDTMANLTLTQQGKQLLEQHYSQALKSVFEDYASLLHNLTGELKNRAFNSLQMIFTSFGEPSPQTSEILHKWFIYLAGGKNMQFLMNYCRLPFPDIKVACLSLIKALCAYEWGVEALKNTAGFVEFLLDRQIEFDKEAKYVKYEVIKILANSTIFDVQTHLQLTKFLNEGPYYVQSAMDVAVEGE